MRNRDFRALFSPCYSSSGGANTRRITSPLKPRAARKRICLACAARSGSWPSDLAPNFLCHSSLARSSSVAFRPAMACTTASLSMPLLNSSWRMRDAPSLAWRRLMTDSTTRASLMKSLACSSSSTWAIWPGVSSCGLSFFSNSLRDCSREASSRSARPLSDSAKPPFPGDFAGFAGLSLDLVDSGPLMSSQTRDGS